MHVSSCLFSFLSWVGWVVVVIGGRGGGG